MEAIVGKRYLHYKGNEYTVIAIAHHEENPERIMVVYRAEYMTPDFGSGCVWVRDLASFEGVVTIDGIQHDRFTLIE